MKRDVLHEYINDFLYFVIKPYEEGAGRDLICCSGVNVDRFMPITKGRHNPMSNPAIRGLQLTQYDIMALALEDGTTAKRITGYKGKTQPPTKELWSTESLLIKNASSALPERIINFSILELLTKIDLASTRGATLPDRLLSPEDMQKFLESLCKQYASQAA